MSGILEQRADPAAPPTDEERRYLRALLREFARPRLSGSEGAAITAGALRRELEGLGYTIEELPFSFSTWPARFVVPVVGATYLATTLTAGGLLREGKRSAAAATLLALPPLLAGVVGGASALVGPLPWGRVLTSNWIAYRPGCRSRYLVMAHRDSKSQPVSTAVRTLGAATAILAWLSLLGLAIPLPRPAPGAMRGGAPGRASGPAPRPRSTRRLATRGATALGVLAGGILLRCRVGNESPGALDNASGLAALVGIARREGERGDVAFLITDGEELWLAGARAVARQLPRIEAIINLDGLDDHGAFHLIERRHGVPTPSEVRLRNALVASAATLGHPLVRRGLPPGILVDHLPLARAGHPAVTLMHGSRRSLGRVHRPSDSSDRLIGEGVQRTVALVCHALARVRRGGARLHPGRLRANVDT